MSKPELSNEEGKPTPGQIGLVETEIARWLWSLQRQPRLKGDPAITQGLCEQIASIIESGRFSVSGQGQEERDYTEKLEDALVDLAHLCYAPPEHFLKGDGHGNGVCGTCDLGQDGSKVHGEGCGLQLGWDIYLRREKASADKAQEGKGEK